jgi:uncharacterized flavoprotein (TIGR03862 family)
MSVQPPSPDVLVVGGGPGGLMAAERCAAGGASVVVIEHRASVGRTLLLAGRSGLNLTHAEPLDSLLDRYGRARPRLEPAIRRFGPDDLRAWCHGLGETTFVGSSGRVFPDSFRATPLLRAWLRRLDRLGVQFRVHHRWMGWRGDGVVIADRSGATSTVTPRATVLALGGASWPRVGSDGSWVPYLRQLGVDVVPFRPANCGFDVAWTDGFVERFAGTPLKNIRLRVGDVEARGDAVITTSGLESGAVYAVSAPLRDLVDAEGSAMLHVDLQPDLDTSAVAARLARGRAKDSRSTALRRSLKAAPVAIGLLREVTGNRLPDDPSELAALVKAAPVTVTGTAPIERAISSAGGVALDEVDDSFMLLRRPGVFVVGEMLDWEAPTGGYLLQGVFSTAVAAGDAAMVWQNVAVT